MTDKFLGTGNIGNNISNGTVSIYGSKIGAKNLDPSRAVKTDSQGRLHTTDLDIADINNLQSVLDNIAISNPYTPDGGVFIINGGLECNDIETQSYFSVNQELQKIDNFTASQENITNVSGLINTNEIATSKMYNYTKSTFLELDDTDINISATKLTFNGDDVLTTDSINELEEKTINVPIQYNPFIYTDAPPINTNENRVYLDDDLNLYSGSFGDGGYPEQNTLPDYYTGTTRSVATEAELNQAIQASVDYDVILITASFFMTSSITINKKLKIRASTPIYKLTFASATQLFLITSSHVWFSDLSFNNLNTGSNANILTFNSTSAINNFVTGCIFESNEFAISSNNTNIQITDNTFKFVGTPDSHRYIYLTGCLGSTFINNNIFEGNGIGSTQCIFISNALAPAFASGNLIIRNNISAVAPVQRLLMLEVNMTNANFSLYVSSNTMTTMSGFIILYSSPLDGIKQIYLYNNTEILGVGNTGTKGIIGLDSPSASVISFNTKIYSSRNTIPVLRADYTDLINPLANQPKVIAYATARFSPLQTYDIIIPFVASLAGTTTDLSALETKTQNINSSGIGLTTISGTVETSTLSSTTVKVETITNELLSSSIELTTGAVNIMSDAINFNSNSMLYTPYPNSVEAGSFIKTGGTNTQYLLADGSTLQQSAVSGNSNFYLYNNSVNLSPPPTNGFIQYNNAVQQNATIVYVSHITSDMTDIEVFFDSVNQLNDLYIQDKNDSANYIKYNITGTPTILVGQYMSVPVVALEFGGNGGTSFGVNHAILLSFFSNNLEIDTRLSSLEDLTQNQTAVSGTTTFSGIGGVVADKFVVNTGTESQFLKGNGTLDSNTYLTTETTLTSDGGNTSLVVDGVGPDLHVKSLIAGFGINFISGIDFIEVQNSYIPTTITLDNNGLIGSQSIVSDGVGPDLAVKGLRQGTDINLTSNANEVTINYDDTRLLAVENKTQKQSATATTTTFTGSGGIVADKFVLVGGTLTQILKADGSVISGTNQMLVKGDATLLAGTSSQLIKGDATLLFGTSTSLVKGNATTLSGTNAQFVKGDATLDSTTYLPTDGNILRYGGLKFSTLTTVNLNGVRSAVSVFSGSISGVRTFLANEAVVGTSYSLHMVGTIASDTTATLTFEMFNSTFALTSSNIGTGTGFTYALRGVFTVRQTTELVFTGDWVIMSPTVNFIPIRNAYACNTSTPSTFDIKYTSNGSTSLIFSKSHAVLTKLG